MLTGARFRFLAVAAPQHNEIAEPRAQASLDVLPDMGCDENLSRMMDYLIKARARMRSKPL